MNSGGAGPLADLLATYRPRSPGEAADVEALRAAALAGDVWSRRAPLHVTGSALVVDPPGGRLLLRWHPGLERWLQVGGHADPGERDPARIALREAREETGLDDLVAFAGAGPVQVVVVDVPAGERETAHRHADVRYLFATGRPDAAVAEGPACPLRWVTPGEAADVVTEDNLRVLVDRAADALARTAAGPGAGS